MGGDLRFVILLNTRKISSGNIVSVKLTVINDSDDSVFCFYHPLIHDQLSVYLDKSSHQALMAALREAVTLQQETS